MRICCQAVIANERHKVSVVDVFGRVNIICLGGAMFEADKPIRHVKEDKYGREKYVNNLAYAILTDDDSDGLIVGIEGEWGSGKTSIKNMLIECLRQMPLPNRKTHLIEFDAWMYSRSGEMVSALFSEISAGLSPRLKWYQKLRVRLNGYRDGAFKHAVQLGLDILGACPFPANVSIAMAVISWSFQTLSEELSSIPLQGGTTTGRGAKAADGLRQTRDALKRNLNSQSDRIVVFIDDLDRLLDDEIGSLIQAVKAVGDLPHVTYVLFYDKAYVAQALNKMSHDCGAEFLEKVVQIPAVVPEPSLNDLRKMLKSEILRVGWRSDFSLGRERDIFDQCICPFIRGKRDIVRFLNDFRLYYAALGDDVELLDLAGITALRIFCPELYRWISENRSYLTDLGPVDDGSVGMNVGSQARKQKALKEKILAVDDTGAYSELLVDWKSIAKILFPLVGNILDNQSRSWVPDSYRAMCKKEHVDAYFRLVPSTEDIPEKWYKRFLCGTNLDTAQPGADLMQVAYSPRLREKIKRYVCGEMWSNDKRMCMLLRFYLKNSFSFDYRLSLDEEKRFYPYVLNLFDLACETLWSSSSVEELLKECLHNEDDGALLVDIYLAVLCELQFLSTQGEEDRQWDKLCGIWGVDSASLDYRNYLFFNLDNIDWGKYAEYFKEKIQYISKKQLNNDFKLLPVHLSFYELRLTMAMLGWLFGNMPSILIDALLSLNRYIGNEDWFVFLSAAALVIKQEDGNYSVDVQTAKHLFKPVEYLDLAETYAIGNELQHKTDWNRERQLCHAAYAFALKGDGVTIRNGKVQVTSEQVNTVLKKWGLDKVDED